MAKKHFATVTFPDGTISTRQTNHNYTHCVARFNGSSWREITMHSNFALATKSQNQHSGSIVFPVTISEKKPNPQSLAVKVQKIHDEQYSSISEIRNQTRRQNPEIYDSIRTYKLTLEWKIWKAVSGK